MTGVSDPQRFTFDYVAGADVTQETLFSSKLNEQCACRSTELLRRMRLGCVGYVHKISLTRISHLSF